MIHAPLERNMLSNSNRHVLGRRHIDYRRLARIGVWDPERDGESICGATEGHRQRAHKVQEQGREAILKG